MPTPGSPIQPLADYVVAHTEEAASKTASGLYLPEAAREKSKTAVIVAVGKNIKEVKVGDRIIYENYAETSVKVGGKEYLIVKEDKIIATVK